MSVQKLLDYFSQCEVPQRETLLNQILQIFIDQQEMVEFDEAKVVKCPHCLGRKIRGNGKLKGVQRYFCKDCNKNFSQTTGKVWFALKKRNLLKKYLICLLSGYSIRKSAQITGISIQTSFDWRHKLLRSFITVLPSEFEGIVESNHFVFEYSEKGKSKRKKELDEVLPDKECHKCEDRAVAVLGTCDRFENKEFKVLAMGKIRVSDLKRALSTRLANAEIVCSEIERSFAAFAKVGKFEYKKINIKNFKKVTDKVYHTRNIKHVYFKLLEFMQRFHGVATKYLQNYFNWFLLLEKIKNTIKKLANATRYAIKSEFPWFAFKAQHFNIYFRT